MCHPARLLARDDTLVGNDWVESTSWMNTLCFSESGYPGLTVKSNQASTKIGRIYEIGTAAEDSSPSYVTYSHAS